MKIVIVAPPAFPVSRSTGSSVEISLYQLAKRMARFHKVTVLSRNSMGLPRASTEGNLRIVRLATQSYLQNIIKFLRQSKFDVLQIENRPHFVPLLRKYFPRKRIVLVLHSLTFMSQLSVKIQKAAIKSANSIVCNSHYIKNLYCSLFPAYRYKFKAIHLGVDLTRFRKPSKEEQQKQRRHYGLSSSKYQLLYAGRIISGKGVHLLIRAASILQKNKLPIHVVIVGRCQTGYCKTLRHLSKKLSVPTTFIGKVPPSLMHKAYWLGDCFVCPTQFREAFGLVNVEAMASGLPVVASKRGGIVEIVNPKNGILVKNYRSPIAFSNAIKQLIQSPQLSKNLAKAGENTVKRKFSWDHAAEKYHRFYLGSL